jgi:uncharacterized protein (DUF305 family)
MREATQMDHALSESAQAYMDAMQTMMDGMEGMEMRGEPNADFALMMIPHHQSAIDMAEAYLEHGDDPELTNLANEIIAAQQARDRVPAELARGEPLGRSGDSCWQGTCGALPRP